ncbi:Protein transport protein S9 plasma membrane t-SNARE [Kickxella alabastrina]|uniref:Protein transport protein S9 plasma membrane t-SNARE n=1 Tax=Kickxella alabastrina TaxID=61397 RepID=A0ACC1IIC1_9FUNG|nr:Protein transport protein S9 plasma membrane t-SNARE [Kickxella alabastrina]
MSSYRNTSSGNSYGGGGGQGKGYDSGAGDARAPSSRPSDSLNPFGSSSSSSGRPVYTDNPKSSLKYEGKSSGGYGSGSDRPSRAPEGRADTRGYAAASREGRDQDGKNNGGQYSSRYGNGSQYGASGQNGGSRYGNGGQYGASGQYGGSRYQQDQNDYDEEDDEIDSIKASIHEKKTDTLESTRRALRTLQDTEEVGAKTLTKLGEQSEQLNRIERTMELANMKAENSVEDTSKLRTLNRSMFAVHVKNPFSGKKRREMQIAKVEADQERERLARDRERESNQESRSRLLEHTGRDGSGYRGPAGRMDANGKVLQSYSGLSQGERSRYTFEDEDPELEDEIDDNVGEISSALGRLKNMSLATQNELNSQFNPLRRIADKSDKTSDNIGIARFHLDNTK